MFNVRFKKVSVCIRIVRNRYRLIISYNSELLDLIVYGNPPTYTELTGTIIKTAYYRII